MPLLEVSQSRQISASVRLDESTATQIDQYASFIHACADDVIEQALKYIFSKDRDFQEFLKSPEANKVTPTLRIRKAPQSVDLPEAEKKPNVVVKPSQNSARNGEAHA
ncbi:MAG TPA: hypothetical protein VGL89_08045 [Candidatus Koribacter sp.]